MFSKVFAAAALAVVSAADVPVFSSNDDYDEINLNIRMLSGNGTTVPSTHELPVNMTMAVTMATDPATDTTFKEGTKTSIKTAANANTISADFTSSSRRRLSEDRRLTSTLYTVAIVAKLGFTNSAAANAAITTVQTSAFLANVVSGVNTAMQGVQGYTPITTSSISGITSGSVIDCSVGTCESNAAPGGGAAAAAPSPSPSSNAAKVAVSTLAAFAAFMASMF